MDFARRRLRGRLLALAAAAALAWGAPQRALGGQSTPAGMEGTMPPPPTASSTPTPGGGCIPPGKTRKIGGSDEVFGEPKYGRPVTPLMYAHDSWYVSGAVAQTMSRSDTNGLNQSSASGARPARDVSSRPLDEELDCAATIQN